MRHGKYYNYGEVEFYLPEYPEPTDEECHDLLNMILLQATRDFITYQNPRKPTDREIFFTASGLLFDDNYTIFWGGQERKADYIYEVLGLDREWIKEGIRERLRRKK